MHLILVKRKRYMYKKLVYHWSVVNDAFVWFMGGHIYSSIQHGLVHDISIGLYPTVSTNQNFRLKSVKNERKKNSYTTHKDFLNLKNVIIKVEYKYITPNLLT